MTEANSPEATDDLSVPASEKQIAFLVYGLHALSFFTGGLTGIVAIIINYIKRPEITSSVVKSHFDWQIRTFWWALAWGVVCFILLFVYFLGLFLAVGLSIWMIYRIVRGAIQLNENKGMYV